MGAVVRVVLKLGFRYSEANFLTSCWLLKKDFVPRSLELITVKYCTFSAC